MPNPTVEEIARVIEPKAFDDLYSIMDLWGPKAAKCASYDFTCDKICRANNAAARLLAHYKIEEK